MSDPRDGGRSPISDPYDDSQNSTCPVGGLCFLGGGLQLLRSQIFDMISLFDRFYSLIIYKEVRCFHSFYLIIHLFTKSFIKVFTENIFHM